MGKATNNEFNFFKFNSILYYVLVSYIWDHFSTWKN